MFELSKSIHAGYGEINYRDRALIVTILLAVIILLRLIQIVLAAAGFRKRSAQPMFFVTRPTDRGPHLTHQRIGETKA